MNNSSFVIKIQEMKKIYYLSTCNTCKRILEELNLSSDVILQDIKVDAITASQLEEMKMLSESYEALFSRRAQLYKQRELADKNLSETDYKQLILEHYTFLKRPVIMSNGNIFIGNAKNTVEAAKKSLHE